VEVEQMQSGVTVNLPGAVLFSTGSAELGKSGKKVLFKLGNMLREVPYQTVVAGFTDNVPIGGMLAERYPTNWELAGARAARVVRLLEEAGVARNRLLAVSFGENQPEASNDTPEGRAENRRIEIRLRPIVIEE
jgi:chemotaxis protein MotB